jgi:DNA-binding transcriptional regulator PaaX
LAAHDDVLDLGRFESRAGKPYKPRPSAPEAVFAGWIRMFTSWRHFPLVDPELPDSLLPARWPRARARALFVRRNEEWSDVALEYFRSLGAGRPGHEVPGGLRRPRAGLLG